MLEFIVLGQIPGTPLVITFLWIVIVAVLLSGYVALHAAHKHETATANSSLEELAL